MRRFDIVYKIPDHGLGSAKHSLFDLDTMAENALARISNECPGLPNLTYTMQWKDMSRDTLGYTQTYYQWNVSNWIPAYQFDIYLNPTIHWWNGECDGISWNEYDVQTVVLHEMLHGLGFLSTIRSDKKAFPSNFDVLIQDENGQSLVTQSGTYSGTYTGTFGQNVYIDNVQLYNPSSYNSGSSLSHVHKSQNVMSWYQSSCHRDLDVDTKTILRRIGYNCGGGSASANEPVTPVTTNAPTPVTTNAPTPVTTNAPTPVTTNAPGMDEEEEFETSKSFLWLGISGVAVLIIVIMTCLSCCRRGRKKRIFEPLLNQ